MHRSVAPVQDRKHSFYQLSRVFTITSNLIAHTSLVQFLVSSPTAYFFAIWVCVASLHFVTTWQPHANVSTWKCPIFKSALSIFIHSRGEDETNIFVCRRNASNKCNRYSYYSTVFRAQLLPVSDSWDFLFRLKSEINFRRENDRKSLLALF